MFQNHTHTHDTDRRRHRRDPRRGPDGGASFGFFSGGRGRGGMVRRGEIRPLILAVLTTRPMHGYEVITELEAQSGGRWRPSAGSVYPTLSSSPTRASSRARSRRPARLRPHRRGQGRGRCRSPLPVAVPTGGAATTSASWLARWPRPRCRSSGWARPRPPSAQEILIDTRAKLYGLLADPDQAATCRPTTPKLSRPTRPERRIPGA